MSHCYAVQNPIFQPAMRIITAITQANPAQVTTSFAHQYITGLQMRLDIPIACGMQQADQFVGPIVVNSPTTFLIALDTTTFEPFSIPLAPSPHVNTCAQAVPVGEVNSILTGATVNILNANL
jgi:hypothetical protein